MWDYSETVKEHFYNPRNAGVAEEANATGDVGSLSCGDALRLTLKVNPETEIIEDAGFQTFGCGSAIASSSALTEIIKGMTLDDALNVSNQDIADYLEGLPPEKMHCSVMGRDAFEKAIANYRGEAEKKVEGEIVCECFGVTDIEIKRAVKENNLKSIEDVTSYVKAGGGCENCHEKIQEIIDTNRGLEIPVMKKPPRLTNIQKIKLIEETLKREIQPALKKDGGNIELVDVDGNNVFVKLQGTCATCSASQITLKHYVESKLREFVTPELLVEEVH